MTSLLTKVPALVPPVPLHIDGVVITRWKVPIAIINGVQSGIIWKAHEEAAAIWRVHRVAQANLVTVDKE